MHIKDDELATVAGVGALAPKRQEGSISPSRERKLTFTEPLTLIVTTRPPTRLPNGGDATNDREGRYVKFDDHGEMDNVSLSIFTARVNGTTTCCRHGEDAQVKAAKLTGGGAHAIVSLDMYVAMDDAAPNKHTGAESIWGDETEIATRALLCGETTRGRALYTLTKEIT